jgi:hypothetical protein
VPAFHHAFLTAGALIIAAGLVALTIRDSDAAASMLARARRQAPAAEPVPVPVSDVGPAEPLGDAAEEPG